MKVIWKFPIQIQDYQSIRMPTGAEILAVQVQGGSPILWALVDPSAPLVSRQLRIIGTGHPISDNPGKFVDTFQLGGFVGHVFDAGESS